MPGREIIFLYGESVPQCTHHIDKKYVGYCTIQYMSAGGVDLWVGPKHYRLEGRWFWSAYPGPRIRFHAGEGYESWEHRYLAFAGTLVKRWENAGLFPIAPRQPAADYSERFDELLQQATRSDRRSIFRAANLLEGILLELAETPVSAEQPEPWIERALKTISGWARGGVADYGALVESLQISESTLRRRFARATGTTPHGYLLQCRIGEARRLLGQTDLPIKAIAERLGYRDVYFFSRQFRQLTGVPPAAYRLSRQ